MVLNANNELFENSKMVLMSDTHICNKVPMGYTQTVTCYILIGQDLGCVVF
jgi:hypothetical protein